MESNCVRKPQSSKWDRWIEIENTKEPPGECLSVKMRYYSENEITQHYPIERLATVIESSYQGCCYNSTEIGWKQWFDQRGLQFIRMHSAAGDTVYNQRILWLDKLDNIEVISIICLFIYSLVANHCRHSKRL